MAEYFDALETRSAQQREHDLFDDLPEVLADIVARIPGWGTRFKEHDLTQINSREKLATLPVMRKPDLMAAQNEKPPFGDFVDTSLLAGNRIFMSPGPVWEPQAPGSDPWQAARSFHAAGFRAGDLVHCSMGFTMTPGGAILDEGIRALGGVVYPAGVGNTEAQVDAAHTLKPVAYAGTPDYLQTMLDKADEMGKDLSSIKRAFVSGGALFPSMREAYEARGISEPGEVGEMVVTSFNKAYPLIRFGTGDMSALIEEQSPCGRTNMRIKGWMGRADQRTKIKGMFVDPKQIDQLVKAVDGMERACLVVSRENNKDTMILKAVGRGLNAQEVQTQLANIAKLNGTVEVVESLPNDGKVIDDQRDYTA